MADPIMRFNQNSVTGKKKTNSSYQTKRYPEGVILYTTSAELPDTLSANALIFTTDTAELYVGTGTGLQKLKLGSEADLDPAIYLKIDTARAVYQSKLQAEEKANDIKGQIATLKESVYSKEDIDKFITEDIDLDGVIDKMNFYTVERINALLEERAAAADVYTRTQADAIFNTKAEVTAVEELSNKYNTLDNTVTELSSTVATKAAAANVYTKAETDGFISSVNELVVTNSNDITVLQNTVALAEDVNREVSTIKEDILSLKDTKADISYVDEKDTELNDSIINISRNLEDLSAQVYRKDDIDNKLLEVNNSVETVSNNLSETAIAIRDEIAAVNSVVTENKVNVNSNSLAIADNKTAIDTVVADISNLQTLLAEKAAATDVYTKQEIVDLLAAKANLDEVFKKIDTYSAEKIQELFAAEDETDLGLFYTKTEIDSMLESKVSAEVFAETETMARDNRSAITTLTDITIPGISTKADNAVEIANSALEIANDSKTTANFANDTAIEAKAIADAAKTLASEAKTLASSTSGLAESANEKSDIAVETARTAEDAVQEAVRSANACTTRIANVELNLAAIKNNSVNLATMTAELNKKADLTLLDLKASKVELEQGLLTKVNVTDFEALQDTVATKDDVAVKANTSDVDQQISTINSNIKNVQQDIADIKNTMANNNDVNSKLSKKADANKVYTKEEVDALIEDVVTQVLNELTFKLLNQ